MGLPPQYPYHLVLRDKYALLLSEVVHEEMKWTSYHV